VQTVELQKNRVQLTARSWQV